LQIDENRAVEAGGGRELSGRENSGQRVEEDRLRLRRGDVARDDGRSLGLGSGLRIVAIVALVGFQRLRDRGEIGLGAGDRGALLGAADETKRQAEQDGDDRNDGQQFDERKAGRAAKSTNGQHG